MNPPSSPSTRVFLFAGGGTGGHIYPGLAIAEQLRARIGDEARCTFICSDRRIDSEILSSEHASFQPIAAKPVSLRPMGLLRFLFSWGPSVRAGREMIRRARAESGAHNVEVIAMGGFVAAPIAQAARVERCPLTLVNLDAVPGKANRWIAGRADQAFSTFRVTAPYAASWRVVPPIVRAAALTTCTPQEARRQLGLDPGRPVLMVTGGSQGAGSINQFMARFAQAHKDVLAGWQVVHQTGEEQNQALIAAYASAGVAARVEKFVRGIGLWWRSADLAVSRAGAGSVAEAWGSAVPTLFLPYPWHRDQHQRLNAADLEASGGGVIQTDAIDPSENLRTVGPVLIGLLASADRRHAMAAAIVALGPVDGARMIAEALTPTG